MECLHISISLYLSFSSSVCVSSRLYIPSYPSPCHNLSVSGSTCLPQSLCIYIPICVSLSVPISLRLCMFASAGVSLLVYCHFLSLPPWFPLFFFPQHRLLNLYSFTHKDWEISVILPPSTVPSKYTHNFLIAAIICFRKR